MNAFVTLSRDAWGSCPESARPRLLPEEALDREPDEGRPSGQAEQQHQTLSTHFVAFDVDAKVFDPVKKLGATVVGAADEKQLNTQLEFILRRQILLEDEELPVKR